MEAQAISALFNSLGVSGIFVALCWYLMRRMEERERKRIEEAEARETRLLDALKYSDTYCRTTMAITIDKNSHAMQNMSEATHHIAQALEGLPCKQLQPSQIESTLNEGRNR